MTLGVCTCKALLSLYFYWHFRPSLRYFAHTYMRSFSLYMKKIIVTMLLCIKIIFFLPDLLENNEVAKDRVRLLHLHLTQKQKHMHMHMYIDRWERDVVYTAVFIPHQMHSPVVLGGSNGILLVVYDCCYFSQMVNRPEFFCFFMVWALVLMPFFLFLQE